MIVSLNGHPTELAEGATLALALEALDVEEPRRGIAVAVDEEVVPRGEWGRHPLRDGARVEVVAAIQGG